MAELPAGAQALANLAEAAVGEPGAATAGDAGEPPAAKKARVAEDDSATEDEDTASGDNGDEQGEGAMGGGNGLPRRRSLTQRRRDQNRKSAKLYRSRVENYIQFLEAAAGYSVSASGSSLRRERMELAASFMANHSSMEGVNRDSVAATSAATAAAAANAPLLRSQATAASGLNGAGNSTHGLPKGLAFETVAALSAFNAFANAQKAQNDDETGKPDGADVPQVPETILKSSAKPGPAPQLKRKNQAQHLQPHDAAAAAAAAATASATAAIGTTPSASQAPLSNPSHLASEVALVQNLLAAHSNIPRAPEQPPVQMPQQASQINLLSALYPGGLSNNALLSLLASNPSLLQAPAPIPNPAPAPDNVNKILNLAILQKMVENAASK